MAFNQNAYHVPDLGKLRDNSKARVEADETFKKVTENAQRLRKKRDQTQYALQLEKFRQNSKKEEEEAKSFDNIFKPIEIFNPENPMADRDYIKSDTGRVARNDSWIKEKKKDIQLYEAYRIMLDMIAMGAGTADRK